MSTRAHCKRWLKIGLLLALPTALYLAAAERASWRPQVLFDAGNAVKHLKFSPNGNDLVVATGPLYAGDPDARVLLWDIQRQKLYDDMPIWADVDSIDFSPDSTLLAVAGTKDIAGREAYIQISEIETGKILRTLPFKDKFRPTVRALSISETKIITVVTTHGKVEQREVGTGRVLRAFRVSPEMLADVVISPDATKLAEVNEYRESSHDTPEESIPFSEGKRQGVRIIDLKTGRLLRTLDASYGSRLALAFSADGNILAADDTPENEYGYSESIKLWNHHTGKLLRTLKLQNNGPASVLHIVFSTKESIVAVAGRNIAVSLWNAETGELLRTIVDEDKKQFSKQAVTAISFSPDGRYLAVGKDNGTVKLWRIR